MPVNSLVDNIVTVATVLCDETRFPTGKANIRKLSVKTPKSEQGFVIYVSIASPNSVVMPTPKKEKVSPVVGEVSTAGVTVAVHPSGRVHIKSVDKNWTLRRWRSSKRPTRRATSPKTTMTTRKRSKKPNGNSSRRFVSSKTPSKLK
ncbi:unnamed protein product [Nesidiocoris tenuis]|uniref:Uncharacterized protein n=1 Tax=Nesidiocoris tenuis TaxID=355587 RepID=A0A6H5H4Y4_9HEMI|nr:unnamed protein product [Nesidiocoris tenuis]CAB0012567.1 unnamed protein product [Nesidiocoris tenuis]